MAGGGEGLTMMEEALRAVLLETAALAAIVGDRIDWGVHPQGRKGDAVTLNVVAGAPGMTTTGADGWERARVQIDCWADTFKASRDAADAIGGRGGVLTALRITRNGVRLRARIISRRSGNEGGAASTTRHRTSLDALVWSAPEAE